MSPLPARADTRLTLASRGLFSFDARDRSLTTRTGHVLTHTRASTTVITATDTTEVEIGHSALGWSAWGGAVGLRVDPAAGNALLPGGDPVVGRAADALTTTLTTRLPDSGSGLVRCHRAAWMDLGGTLAAGYFLGLGASNPRLALYALAASRTLRIELVDGAATAVGAEAAIPAGSVLAIAWQWRNLSTGGSVRLDVGAGFGAWSSACAAITALGTAALTLGGSAHASGNQCATGLCQVRLWSGHLTRQQLVEVV